MVYWWQWFLGNQKVMTKDKQVFLATVFHLFNGYYLNILHVAGNEAKDTLFEIK